jgi:hypothetical protein
MWNPYKIWPIFIYLLIIKACEFWFNTREYVLHEITLIGKMQQNWEIAI